MKQLIYYKNMYRSLKYMSWNMVKYNRLSNREILYFENQDLAYIAIGKVANSSIKGSLIPLLYTDKADIDDDYSIHSMQWNRLSTPKKIPQSAYCFAFVRNPFDRLVSAYKSKLIQDVQKGYGYHLDKYLFGYIKQTDTFETFVRKVSNIGDIFADIHFRSQYHELTSSGVLVPQYIGKFENLKEDFEPIRTKYDLEPLPHFNKTEKQGKTYMDRYTIDLVEKVYQRYKKDVHEFGYYDDYLALREYVSEKGV